MTIKEKKKRLMGWTDLCGFDLVEKDQIESAKTNKDLEVVLSRHVTWLEDLLADAIGSVNDIQKELKI